jgi:hypothetical protein
MSGVVLVALSQNLPEAAQTLAAAIRALGFAGMGAALLRPFSFGIGHPPRRRAGRHAE